MTAKTETPRSSDEERAEMAAILNQLSADLAAAIAEGKTRTYWQCGGDRIKHRSRRTAGECRNSRGRFLTKVTYAPKVPGISQTDYQPKGIYA